MGMEVKHFKEVMEELERFSSIMQTHWQPGNLIERIFFKCFLIYQTVIMTQVY